MISGLSLAYGLTLHGLVTLVAVLLYALTSHLRQQRRHPTAAIAWVLFILLLPYVALPAFLAFGSRKQARPRIQPVALGHGVDGPWAVRTALALGQPAPTPYHDLRLHEDGQAALVALWEVIDAATVSIDLCTFILGRDAVGEQLIRALGGKARAGVRVRMLLDGMGSLMRSRPDLRPLRAAGVEFTLFVPPLHSPLKGRTNLRDHRKLLIADAGGPQARLWCGGRNMASEYFEGSAEEPAWHDLSFDLRGEFVSQASDLFAHDWAFANGVLAEPTPSLGAPPDAAPASAEPGVEARSDIQATAQLIASGPDQVDDTVYSMLLSAAYRARHRICMVTPYFVPDAALLGALCLAARRGVLVELLLPARSNHRLSDVARRRALRTLAAAGARLRVVDGMHHAKLVVVDDTLALAGSANLDSRSLFLNYELMVAFHDARAVNRFGDWLARERARATPLVPTPAGLLADMAEGLVLWVGFQL